MVEGERDDAEDIDTQITDLISKKIAAEDADSGWVLAYTAMRMMPMLKDIEAWLGVIAYGLGGELRYAVGEKQSQVEDLRRIFELIRERGGRR